MKATGVVPFVGMVLVLVVVAVLVAVRLRAEETNYRDLLNRNGHLLVSRALAEGRKSAQFIIAYDPQSNEGVAEEVKSDGATIRKAIPRIGFVRAEIPLDRLDAVMQHPAIEAIDYLAENQFDVDLAGVKPTRTNAGSDGVPPSKLPTPGPRTPSENPFTGLRVMGVPAFLKQHPTYDGRGVVIGFLEPASPFAPGLQKALALDGSAIQKFAAYRVVEGPYDAINFGGIHNVRLGWVDMRRVVVARNGRFAYKGAVYRAPYDGTFRLGFFSTTYDRDIRYKNTDSTRGRALVPPTMFPILWDEPNGKVWIDVHRTGDFARAQAIGDFHGTADIVALPLQMMDWAKYGDAADSNIASEASKSTHVAIETDPTDHFIRLETVGLDTHASMVAGSAAGNGFFNGAFDGVAPSAQVSVMDGYWPYMIESLNALAESKADVISLSFALTSYAGGGGALDRIVNRIIRAYNVPIVFAADNSGPVIQGIGMPSTADSAISVGGYVSAETARYDQGAVFPYPDGMLATYSARGPANDGAMKPDVIAQTEWLTASSPEAPPQPFRQTRYLPRGYEMGGGTSQAAPSAAGTVALLLSAAKQKKLRYDASLVKRALVATGAPLPYQRLEIGGGLINVPAAWAALQRLAAAPPPKIEVTAPVNTVTSGDLTPPNVGHGLYEREGWHAGMAGTRAITYTLSADAPRGATYAVRVVGDSQTFSAPTSITLQPGVAVSLPIQITARASGIHSALIVLSDAATQAVVDQRLCTIVAAERFWASNNYTITHAGSVEHPGFRRYFFDVPKQASAFTVGVDVVREGLASEFDPFTASEFMYVRQPDGRQPATTARYQPINEGLHWAQAFDHPIPGVWEVDIVNWDPSSFGATPKRAAPIPPTHYRLRSSAYSVVVNGAPQFHGSSVRVTLTNRMAPLGLDGSSVALAQVKDTTVHIAPGRERWAVGFDVPADTTEVFARLERPSARDADVSVYLFNCARNVGAAHELWLYQGKCTLGSSANTLRGDGVATTANPSNFVSAIYPSVTVPKGRWVAVVDGMHLTGPVTLKVETGTASLATVQTSSMAPRPVGSNGSWTQSFKVPSPAASTSTVALLALHAADVLTIWQMNNAELITTMKKSKPKILHRSGTVWSAMVPLR